MNCRARVTSSPVQILIWILFAISQAEAVLGASNCGPNAWDVMYGQPHLHEMKILSYNKNQQRVEVGVPCVGSHGKDLLGRLWWKVDWLVFELSSPHCRDQDCYNLEINGVPFLTAWEYQFIKVNATWYCPELQPPFKCGHNRAKNGQAQTVEVILGQTASLDDPPPDHGNVYHEDARLNVNFHVFDPEVLPASAYCTPFRVIWEGAPDLSRLPKGGRRELAGVVLEVGQQVVSPWQIEKGEYPISHPAGRKRCFGAVISSWWPYVVELIRW